MLKRTLYLIIASLIMLPLTTGAQSNEAVYKTLLKRYGHATCWHSSFIVRIDYFSAFADSTGHLLTDFIYRTFDTVLNDRAIGCVDSNYGCDLFTPEGTILYKGNSGGFRLLDKKKRLFATAHNDKGPFLIYSDIGRQLTNHNYDPGSGVGMISAHRYDGRHFYGIVTPGLDTLLPLQYASATFGKKYYAGMRNDTAFVYRKQDKRLLFLLGGIHDFRILANDLMVAKKHGMYALVGKNGKLLTGFLYNSAEEIRYANGPAAPDGGMIPSVSPYLLVNHYGLIDSLGRTVLPAQYNDIRINTNGWFIVKKEGPQGHDQLLDRHKQPIVEVDAYSINFMNERYATITVGRTSPYKATTRTYDMVLCKYVAGMPAVKQEKPKAVIALPRHEHKQEYRLRNSGDSIDLNTDGTLLCRINGMWGIISVTGDTIQPFIYDTVGRYIYGLYFIGVNSRIGALNKWGDLITPVELPGPIWHIKDSLIFMMNKDVYRIKNGHIIKVDVEKEPAADASFRIGPSGITYHEQHNSSLKSGVYNRQLRRIADRLFRDDENGGIRNAGIAAVTDAAGLQLTVIDSTGKQLIPWIQKPYRFAFYDHCAIAVSNTNSGDVLYTFNDLRPRIDTIIIDSLQKRILTGATWTGREDDPLRYRNTTLLFTLPGRGAGFINKSTGNSVIIAGAQKIIKNDDFGPARVRINGRWGLYDPNGRQLVPPDYDTIRSDNYGIVLVQHNKVGLYDPSHELLIPPMYDTIPYAGSLSNRFLIVYKGNKAIFLNEKGSVISSGWEDLPIERYTIVAGIRPSKNGIKYRLYPSLADTLTAVPDTDLPPGVTYKNRYATNRAIAKKKGKYGFYDVTGKKWIIPAIYSDIEKYHDNYIAHISSPATTIVYNSHGLKLLTYPEIHYPEQIYSFNQWWIRGAYKTPIVNYKGKVIVPDSFKSVFLIDGAGRALYHAITNSRSGAIIDTNGRIVIPAIFDYVEDEHYMYNGYFVASQDDKMCLLSPRGKMLTPCIYANISAGLLQQPANARRMYFAPYIEDSNDLRPFFIVNNMETGSAGVLDSKGKTLIPCIYDSIKQVHLGKIAVAKRNEKWGLISISNNPVTSFDYDEIGIFYKGTAYFRRGPVIGTISTTGKESTVR